jgi:selenocysteine lyase/cysteine desulfurase
VDAPGADEKLRKAGVRAAVRAGRVRASFHLYTTDADVDQAVTALV